MKNKGYRISIISIIVNVLLSVFKLLAGILANSSSMISDSVHSLSDVFSTIIVIIGLKIGNKEADYEHPYGHEKYECLAAIILAVILFFTGILLMYNGVLALMNGTYSSIVPGKLAIVAAIVSIIVKELMYQATIKVSRELNSDSLRADAWHHRSDALSSIGALIGIILSRKVNPCFEPIATLVISLFILKASIDILKDSLDKIMDKALDNKTEKDIIKLVKSVDGVIHLDDLKTRLFGSKMYVDIEISVDPDITVREGHKIAENVHNMIEKEYKNCKHCMVHINPVDSSYVDNKVKKK